MPGRATLSRLDRALRVRPEEAGVAHRFLGVMLLAWGGFAIGGSAVESLFFSRFGTIFLPWMYIALGLVTFPASLAFGLVQSRFDHRLVLVVALPGMAVVVGALRVLLLLPARWVYPVLWLSMMVLWIVQAIALWSLAGLVHDARAAKRLFPLYGAGVILGGAVGGVATPPLATALHAENLLVVWAAALLAAGLLATRIGAGLAHRHRWLKGRRIKGPPALQQMKAGLRTVAASILLRRMAWAAVIVAVLGFSLSFPFAVSVTAHFPEPDRLAGFLGTFYGLANAGALVLSLGATNRLFTRFGVTTVVAGLSLLYLLGFGALSAGATFAALAAVRAAQLVWVNGAWGAGWQALYNVVPPDRREQARTFIEGGPAPLGIALAGALLLVATHVSSLRAVFLAGAVIAALGVAVNWGIRRAYRGALVEALREGWPEVFGPSDGAVDGDEWTAEARSALQGALRDPDPNVRRLAMEISADLPEAPAPDLCLSGLSDPDGDIRWAAVRGLGAFGASVPGALSGVIDRLDDADPRVVAAAVDAALALGRGDPAVDRRLADLLGHRSPVVRSKAAVGRIRSGHVAEATESLLGLAASEDPSDRALALAALADAGVLRDRLVSGLSDLDPEVRGVAARALGSSADGLEPLLGALGDEDSGVREIAAAALASIGKAAVPGLVAALEVEPADEAALLALLAVPETDLGAVRAYGRRQAEQAVHYQRLWSAVTGGEDPRLTLLAHALRRRALGHATRATLASWPVADYGEVRLALDAIESRDPNQRAGAIETLDIAGAGEGLRPLMAVWDPEPRPGMGAFRDAILVLMRDDDPWLRACAALAAATIRAEPGLAGALREMAEGDPEPLVRETAGLSLEGGSAVPPAVTLMDRVLALRQVPLFRELGPADLKRVAEATVANDYPDGTAIAEHGARGDAMHVVVTGEIRVLMEAEGDRIVEVARRGPGYIVGEMAILSEEPRMASLVAVGEVRTLSLDRKRFQRILRERPDAALAVMRELCARLREAHDRAPVETRLP